MAVTRQQRQVIREASSEKEGELAILSKTSFASLRKDAEPEFFLCRALDAVVFFVGAALDALV